VNKYLELLPIVADRRWRVKADGLIRDRDGRCPICALAHEMDSRLPWFQMYHSALKGIGLPKDDMDADRVACAADEPKHPLRPALMAALGMKP
jgi:hypothetical protein